jgi:hypothetical protein
MDPLKFNPQRIAAKLQAGELSSPRSLDLYKRRILAPQTLALKLTPGWRASLTLHNAQDHRKIRVTPEIEKLAAEFNENYEQARTWEPKRRKAFFRALSEIADTKEEELSWMFKTSQLVILAWIHLREERQQQCITEANLRQIVTEHLTDNNLPEPSGETWRRAFHDDSDIRRLLADSRPRH